MANIYTRSSYVEGDTSGTSANAYATYTIDVRDAKFVTVYIKNTGAANTVTYKIDKYVNSDGTISQEAVAAADIAHSTTVAFAAENKLVAKYVVSIKSKVADTHSTYKIEYIKG